MKLLSRYIISTNGIVQREYNERAVFYELKAEIPRLRVFFIRIPVASGQVNRLNDVFFEKKYGIPWRINSDKSILSVYSHYNVAFLWNIPEARLQK